jgi:hypothetical protein
MPKVGRRVKRKQKTEYKKTGDKYPTEGLKSEEAGIMEYWNDRRNGKTEYSRQETEERR